MRFKIQRGILKSKLSLSDGGNIPRFIDELLMTEFTTIHFIYSNDSNRPIPIRVRLYENGEFYSGLYVFIRRFLEKLTHKCDIEELCKYYNDDSDTIKKKLEYAFSKIRYILRDYQIEATVKAVRKPLTLVSLPTGSGKSLVISTILLCDNCRTLIVVDSAILMHQLANDIENATGIECGLVGDGKYFPRQWTVAIIDSLQSKKGLDLVKNMEAIYFDEAHKSGADTYRNIIDRGGDNLVIRRGFSATTFRNDNRSLLLPALTGPIVIHYTTSDLITKGWLAKPTIIMPIIDNFKSKVTWYNAIYKSCIINNKLRNRICLEMLVESAKRGDLCVGLFKNVKDHLPLLKEMIYKMYPKEKIAIVHGSIPVDRRRKMIEKFSEGDKRILLASIGTTGEGIDLPGEVKVGVSFVGGTSEIMVRQALGRILRKPKMSNGEVNPAKQFRITYYDPYDETHEEMKRQSQIRMDIYESEPEFSVRRV
jgi:superfamily II DNA or RNA helicase